MLTKVFEKSYSHHLMLDTWKKEGWQNKIKQDKQSSKVTINKEKVIARIKIILVGVPKFVVNFIKSNPPFLPSHINEEYLWDNDSAWGELGTTTRGIWPLSYSYAYWGLNSIASWFEYILYKKMASYTKSV